MFINYIKIAWRNIMRHRLHSILNILGLSIGIAFTLLIAAYVWGELQVNRQLADIDNQYILQSNWKDPNMGLDITTVGPLAKTLKEEYPSLVKNYYRWDGVTSNVSKGDKVFREGLQIGDSTFLGMYGFSLLYGNIKNAFDDPFSVVITEDRALKYFGKSDVVGESLAIESFSASKHDFKITGVMKMPAYSSVNRITFDNDNQIYVPVSSAPYFSRTLDLWNNTNIVAFIELQKGIRPRNLQEPMQRLLRQHSGAQVAGNMQPYLSPLNEYYLNQNNGLVRKMIYVVSFIAIFILLMAVVNFINIAIGRSSTRIKEIGIRKVMGSLRTQLIQQFLTEAILLVFFSTVVALVIYTFANPFLSEILGRPIPTLFSFPFYYCIVPLGLIFVIGILAGIYPAFILSAFKAVDSVKGKLKSVRANIVLRKTLVAFQFFTASIVLIGAIVLSKQVSLFFSNDLGYDKEYVVSAQLPRDWTDAGVQHMKTVRDEFAKMPQVSAATLTWSVPDGVGSGSTLLYPEGKDSSQAIPYESLIADENYLETFKIPLVAGRTFKNPSDSLNILVNETALSALGFPDKEQAIGQRVYMAPDLSLNIIGIISDFHFGSMKDKIRPMMITSVNFNKAYRLLCFKLRPGNIGSGMEAIQKKWSALLPGSSFEYKFMDESLKKLYRSEIQLKKASQVATALAFIIAILGIIGLISLSIQKRNKEIGIRKVLGASLSNIAFLFLQDFLPVIFAGSIIAVPVGWYVMQSWLNDYNYRIAITAGPFLISIIGLASVTAMLIILQTWKATTQNPVKSLRTE